MSDNIEQEISDSDIPAIDIDQLASEAAQGLEDAGPSAESTFTDEAFIAQWLATAKEYVGVSRATDLPQVAKFLELFGLPAQQGGAWVPFCAAGQSYAAAKAWCILAGIPYTAANAVKVFRTVLPLIKARFFLPSPSCWQIKEHAVSVGKWVGPTTDVQSGWLVLYNWVGGSTPDHVGLMTKDHTATDFHDIEFNTSGTAGGSQRDGGVVSVKERPYTHVVGYAKTH